MPVIRTLTAVTLAIHNTTTIAFENNVAVELTADLPQALNELTR